MRGLSCRISNSGADQGSPDRTDSGIVPADLTVSLPSADFGTVAVGTSSTDPTVITVTNKGGPTSLSPSVTGPFAVLSTTCGNLAAGGTCTISLIFTPIAAGPASGVLSVTRGVKVVLTGIGVQPGAIGMTDKVDLGTVTVGATVSGSVIVTALDAVSDLTCIPSGVELSADMTAPCPPDLVAGASCTFGFKFKAATAGAKNDSVVCNAMGVTKTTAVTAIVVTPANLLFQAPTTIFASTPVNTASTPISFTLINTGGSNSGMLAMTPSGDIDQFMIDNQCIVPLTALSFCKINVVFKPTSAGQKVLTLTVTDASAPTTSAVATLNGSGMAVGSPVISGTGDFGTVAVGATSPATVFTISNSGLIDTGILTIAVSDAQFVVTADGCSSLPLAAGKNCTISVVFKPRTAGVTSAVLNASAPGTPSVSLPIKGTGLGAA